MISRIERCTESISVQHSTQPEWDSGSNQLIKSTSTESLGAPGDEGAMNESRQTYSINSAEKNSALFTYSACP